MSISSCVNCPVALQFYISSTCIYTILKRRENEKKRKQMNKIKTFVTDSRPRFVLNTLVNQARSQKKVMTEAMSIVKYSS